MASGSDDDAGMAPPPKPWERPGGSSSPVPFKPPSSATTTEAVEASGNGKGAGEIVPAATPAASALVNSLPRAMPARPWQQGYGSSFGGLGSSMYNSYGGLGSSYGSGLYGGGMYSGYNSGMYGGGLYNNGYMSPYNSYGMGMAGPYGNANQDPNGPFGAPSSPPSLWMSVLRVMHGVVTVFGRIAMLIDQNTQAFHMFINALLQLFDRSGMLYSEIAMFIFNLIGIRKLRRGKKTQAAAPALTAAPALPEAPKSLGGPAWDNVWGGEGKQ